MKCIKKSLDQIITEAVEDEFFNRKFSNGYQSTKWFDNYRLSPRLRARRVNQARETPPDMRSDEDKMLLNQERFSHPSARAHRMEVYKQLLDVLEPAAIWAHRANHRAIEFIDKALVIGQQHLPSQMQAELTEELNELKEIWRGKGAPIVAERLKDLLVDLKGAMTE